MERFLKWCAIRNKGEKKLSSSLKITVILEKIFNTSHSVS